MEDNRRRFIENALLKPIDFDDQFYERFDSFIAEPGFSDEVADVLKEHVDLIDERSILSTTKFLNILFVNQKVVIPQIYDLLLVMLFRPYSLNISIPYKIIDFMYAIRPDGCSVYRDIFNQVDASNLSSVRIGLFSLYGSQWAKEISKPVIEEFANKVLQCLQSDLGSGIKEADLRDLLVQLKNHNSSLLMSVGFYCSGKKG